MSKGTHKYFSSSTTNPVFWVPLCGQMINSMACVVMNFVTGHVFLLIVQVGT